MDECESDRASERASAVIATSLDAPSSSDHHPDVLPVMFLVGMVAVCCLVILCVVAEVRPLLDPQWGFDPTTVASSPEAARKATGRGSASR